MSKIEKFEDIIAWQKAQGLSSLIYKVTNKEKFSKDFDLKEQDYITKEQFNDLNEKVIEVSKTISGFVSYLRTQKTKQQLSKLS